MEKPNIIMIMADDMGYWSMGCAGDGDIKTPNIDYLAQSGVHFENFFCVSPVCSPARASVLTGKIPSQHGIHDWISKGHINYDEVSENLRKEHDKENNSWEYGWSKQQLQGDKAIRYLDGFLGYTEILADCGYECALSGKWHLGDAKNPQKGFTYWKTIAMGGDNYYYPVVLKNGEFDMLREHYITDYITDNALEFINNKHDKPFYLSVHYTSPHSPWNKEQHPKEFYDMYNDCEFLETPNVPPHEWAVTYTKEQRKDNLHGYYAAVSAMDNGIGKIIASLKANNMWENTIIIFTADNGMSMGHHGIFGKGNGTFPMNMYDTAVKVPTIITYPQKIQGGTIAKGLYSHYDIFPTIAELMNTEIADKKTYPGTSFKEILDGNLSKCDNQNKDIVILDEYGPDRMIRTTEFKYVHRYPYGPNELYDLTKDPDENVNEIDNPNYQKTIENLNERLEEWFLKYTDPKMDGTKEAVYGSGQLKRLGTSGKRFITK